MRKAGTQTGKFWCSQVVGLSCSVPEESYRPEYAFPSSAQVEAAGREWTVADCKCCLKDLIWKIPPQALNGPSLQERISRIEQCVTIEQVANVNIIDNICWCLSLLRCVLLHRLVRSSCESTQIYAKGSPPRYGRKATVKTGWPGRPASERVATLRACWAWVGHLRRRECTGTGYRSSRRCSPCRPMWV